MPSSPGIYSLPYATELPIRRSHRLAKPLGFLLSSLSRIIYDDSHEYGNYNAGALNNANALY